MTMPDSDTPVTAPALGTQVQVVAPKGISLMNNETGALFVPGEATVQTVTITTLRRLAAGDLELVA